MPPGLSNVWPFVTVPHPCNISKPVIRKSSILNNIASKTLPQHGCLNSFIITIHSCHGFHCCGQSFSYPGTVRIDVNHGSSGSSLSHSTGNRTFKCCLFKFVYFVFIFPKFVQSTGGLDKNLLGCGTNLPSEMKVRGSQRRSQDFSKREGGGGGHTVSKGGYSPDCHVATCCRLFALKKAYKVRATPGPTPLAMPLGVRGLRRFFI